MAMALSAVCAMTKTLRSYLHHFCTFSFHFGEFSDIQTPFSAVICHIFKGKHTFLGVNDSIFKEKNFVLGVNDPVCSSFLPGLVASLSNVGRQND